MNVQEKKALRLKIFAGVMAFIMIASTVAGVLIYVFS